MENKQTKIYATLLLGLGLTTANAQQAITTSGGNASGSGGSVSYSVGQIVYKTNIGSSGSLAQGVQQPYEISITTGLNETGVNLNLSAYPNPTANYLMLQVDASHTLNQSMSYQLYDMSGKLLESKQVTDNITNIAMEQLATATYFLKVIQNNTEVKSFKIIKN